MPPRTLFQKFGHICEIPSNERDSLTDASTLKRWVCRFLMLNETNQRCYSFLRSQKKIENEHRKMQNYPYIIHPFSDFRVCWEFFISIIIMIQIIMIPLDIALYRASFQYNIVHAEGFRVIRIISDTVSALDIIITFITGICDDQERVVIIDPINIARHYFRTTFFLDLYCSIPVDVILNRFYAEPIYDPFWDAFLFCAHYMGIIKLLRFYHFVKFSSRMFDLDSSETYYMCHRVAMSLVSFLVYLHVLCCLCIAWTGYYMPFDQKHANAPTMINAYGTHISNTFDMYMRFFYSSALMALTTGYGFHTIEGPCVWFMTNVWLISKLLYILAIAYFIQLQTAFKSPVQKYIDMQCEVKDYMRHRQIPNFLQKRILSYYDIKYQSCFFQEAEILHTVSGQLRQEIIMNTCRKFVEDVVFFKNMPINIMVRIVSLLNYDIFLTNDVIAKAGTIGECMYFILNGTVAIYSNGGKELCHLQDGDHFGEIALMTRDSLRIASVVAAEVCELYRLDRKDFVKAVLPYPEVYKKIAVVATERNEATRNAEDIMKKGQQNATQNEQSERTTRTTNVGLPNSGSYTISGKPARPVLGTTLPPKQKKSVPM